MTALSLRTQRPRNVNAYQAAAILYGDWGTSKAYVIGIAFALAGYSSFWLILCASILNAFVGLNYITICRCYPFGGGVYASARTRSKILAVVGGLFLVADYLVTAALSALAAFAYLGVDNPHYYAIVAIGFIGFLNFFGPKNSGSLAFIISVPVVITVILLAIFSAPHLTHAIHMIQPLEGTFRENWIKFVSVVVALSGIEAIANTTSLMELDKGSTDKNPSINQTSKKAILWVMLEVCFFTTLFGLALQAIPGLQIHDGTVDAPGALNVRDYMLRYMGMVFGTDLFGVSFGLIFSTIISIGFFILLLSAVNTAILALVSLLFVISRDKELPASFQKINSYGVPIIPLLIATVFPIIILCFVSDMLGLANLYAIGFVGAIATNLGSTCTNLKLEMSKRARVLMFITFLIMAAIEVTLFIEKTHARNFVMAILAIGLFLRGVAAEQLFKKPTAKPKPAAPELTIPPKITDEACKANGIILCVTNSVNKTLTLALEESVKFNQFLYILFIREQAVLTEEDFTRTWADDPEVHSVINHLIKYSEKASMEFTYIISDSKAYSVVAEAAKVHATKVFLEIPRRNPLLQLLQKNALKKIATLLPDEVYLVLVS